MQHCEDYSDSIYDGMPFALYKHMFIHLNLNGSLTEIQYWIVMSALTRADKKTAIKYLRDWGKLNGQTTKITKPSCEISKFVPGDHYHVLGEKFWSLQEARDFAQKKGYEVARFYEVRIAREGD